MQGKDNPPAYYPPPQQGYAPPPQGYAPPPQGYAPPPQGYAQPEQGYAPPQQGYAPPQQGYAPPAMSQQQQSSNVVIVNQPTGTGVVYQGRPADYTVSSILACLFCFLPTGLLAVYYAHRSRTELALGNVDESYVLAARARNMIVTSVVLGICWMVLVVVLRVVVYSNTYYY